MDAAGWLGWPLASSCKAFGSVRKPLAALKGTKTYASFTRGERAPAVPDTGGEDGFLRFCEASPLPIRLFRDSGLFMNMRHDHGYGQVAYIEDVDPTNLERSSTTHPSRFQQYVTLNTWREPSGACDGLTAHESSALRKLAPVACRLSQEQHQRLGELKAGGLKAWRDPDAVWDFIVQSFATWGRAAAATNLAADPEILKSIKFDALKLLTAEERKERFAAVVRSSGMRWPQKKPYFLCRAFEKIEALGGPEAVKRHIEKLSGADERKKFLESFEGIGPKYSRNFFMDFYHPEFRDAIAIDARIAGILKRAGIPSQPYDYAENFLLWVARAANISGWELDRLMFWNQDAFH